MTDQPQGVSGDEIERLLQQAQEGLPDAVAPPTSAESTPASPAEQVLAAAIGTAVSEAAVSGTAATSKAPAKPAGKPIATPTRDESIASADVELLIRQAQEAIASIDQPHESLSVPPVKAFELDQFTGAAPNTERATLELIRDVELDLRIEFGRTQMYLEDVLKLRKGSVVALDKLAGDPVDIFVNGRLIAKGEVLVLNDNFCVRVAELITGEAPA
jgi:flagellar motor switch protein FliN/FliY